MTSPTKEEVCEIYGNFTWFWGADFFIETPLGNFHWKAPDYDGDDSMTLYPGSFEDFLKYIGFEFGRDKGEYIIRQKCGDEFTLVIPGHVKQELRECS